MIEDVRNLCANPEVDSLRESKPLVHATMRNTHGGAVDDSPAAICEQARCRGQAKSVHVIPGTNRLAVVRKSWIRQPVKPAGQQRGSAAGGIGDPVFSGVTSSSPRSFRKQSGNISPLASGEGLDIAIFHIV